MIEENIVYTHNGEPFIFEKSFSKYRRYHFSEGYFSGWISPVWYEKKIAEGDFIKTGLSIDEYKLIEAL